MFGNLVVTTKLPNRFGKHSRTRLCWQVTTHCIGPTLPQWSATFVLELQEPQDCPKTCKAVGGEKRTAEVNSRVLPVNLFRASLAFFGPRPRHSSND